MDNELDWKLDELLGPWISNKKFSHTKLTSGVSHGLILGPNQCNIFITDLERVYPQKLADDNNLRGVPDTPDGCAAIWIGLRGWKNVKRNFNCNGIKEWLRLEGASGGHLVQASPHSYRVT